MQRLSLVIVILLLSVVVFPAQNTDQLLSVEILSSVEKFKPGHNHRIALIVRIDSPFHINSPQPSEEFMIPTVVSFESGEGMTFGQLEFPSPLIKAFGFYSTPLEVYQGTITIYSSVALSAGYTGDEARIVGIIEYQACDDKACMTPEEISFSQVFPVAGPNEDITASNEEVFVSQAGSPEQEKVVLAEREAMKEPFGERGLPLTMFLVFLGGLALNLTPCVYPLIPITISYFGGQAQGRRGGIVTHAVLYVLGMALTYSILGSAAALTGSLFGAALQNPFVLVGVALVLVGLALSMFNLYEFRLPSFLTNLAGGRKKGLLGTLFMGLTVGFVAAPCIGPFILGLLTFVGEKGNVAFGFLMFFMLALGLGLPFVFLAIFSGSIDRLPRSGAWMVWVRSAFGFILIAMAVYFLEPLFSNALIYHLAMGLSLFVGGIYLAWIEPTKIAGKGFSVIRNVVGILFFAAALILVASSLNSHINQVVNKARWEAGINVVTHEIRWFPYSQQKLVEAFSDTKPVMIDFHAEWCIPCKEMDKSTFTAPEIVDISRNFIMLKADLTTSRDLLTKRLRREFRIRGVPTYVFLKPDGEEVGELRLVGFVKKETLLSRMKAALETIK